MLGLALCGDGAAAQTATEQARILGDFQQGVVDYTQRHTCLSLVPEAINAATPAPRIFTLPVALVFRQLIARALVGHVDDFPQILAAALPGLPAPLEYRLIFNDLVIRDASADVIVAVLRDAIGGVTTR